MSACLRGIFEINFALRSSPERLGEDVSAKSRHHGPQIDAEIFPNKHPKKHTRSPQHSLRVQELLLPGIPHVHDGDNERDRGPRADQAQRAQRGSAEQYGDECRHPNNSPQCDNEARLGKNTTTLNVYCTPSGLNCI